MKACFESGFQSHNPQGNIFHKTNLHQARIFQTDFYKKNVCIIVVFLLAAQLCWFMNLGVPKEIWKPHGGRKIKYHERYNFSRFYSAARRNRQAWWLCVLAGFMVITGNSERQKVSPRVCSKWDTSRNERVLCFFLTEGQRSRNLLAFPLPNSMAYACMHVYVFVCVLL